MSRFFAIFGIACIKYDNRRINKMIVIYAEKSSLDASVSMLKHSYHGEHQYGND